MHLGPVVAVSTIGAGGPYGAVPVGPVVDSHNISRWNGAAFQSCASRPFGSIFIVSACGAERPSGVVRVGPVVG